MNPETREEKKTEESALGEETVEEEKEETTEEPKAEETEENKEDIELSKVSEKGLEEEAPEKNHSAKDVPKPVDKNERVKGKKKEEEFDKFAWNPKTELGKKVKSGEIKDISEILDAGQKILESEIVDLLMPELETELLMIGQSKGKFGGGQRRVFKQTQKKTREGNKPHFSTIAIAGNKNGYVGLGYGSSKETVPAREKAIRNAKLNIIKIRRGAGSWESDSTSPISIPFAVTGKCSSVIVTLLPAPKGTGLCTEKEISKILKFAGITDIRSRTSKRKTKINLLKACFEALKQLTKIKITTEQEARLGVVEGKLPEEATVIEDVSQNIANQTENK